MVILGLGSNVGDSIKTLRETLQHIKQIPDLSVKQISPIYLSDALLPENAPSNWNKPYLNLAIRCETTLEPLALLSHTKHIEKKMGRIPGEDWGPRPVDIDILAWDELVLYDEKLHIPHEHLHNRPFALFPLADVAPRWIYPLKNEFHGKTAAEIASRWPSRFSGRAPLNTRQISQRIDTPELIGIVNITPDSFSDGGNENDIEKIIIHAIKLVEDGATVLDFGAEATGPTAKPIDAETEWKRLKFILTEILALKKNFLINTKISVDTRHPDTVKKSLEAGVDWINDVSGLENPKMLDIIANQHCDVVIMHNLGIPQNNAFSLPLVCDPVKEIYEWANKKLDLLQKLKVDLNRVIVDVGIGFGKTANQSLEVLQRISEFKSLNTKLLVGHSRKSFLKLFSDKMPAERDLDTTVISNFLASQDIDFLRLHNVAWASDTFKIVKCFSAR